MSKNKILVVDDTLSFLKSVEEVLLAENYRVFTADDVQSALQIYRQQSPDLLLTDVNLSSLDPEDKSGIELMKLVYHSANENLCPVILMSSDPSIEDQLDKSQSACVEFLCKPFDPRVLLEKIATYCHS